MRNSSGVDVITLKQRMVQQQLDKICDLSTVSGISRPTIGNLLAGKTQPSTEVINRLMVALQLSPSDVGAIFFAGNLPESEGNK